MYSRTYFLSDILSAGQIPQGLASFYIDIDVSNNTKHHGSTPPQYKKIDASLFAFNKSRLHTPLRRVDEHRAHFLSHYHWCRASSEDAGHATAEYAVMPHDTIIYFI